MAESGKMIHVIPKYVTKTTQINFFNVQKIEFEENKLNKLIARYMYLSVRIHCCIYLYKNKSKVI